jgi:hypothetical protein
MNTNTTYYLIDLLPIWGFFLVTIVLAWLCTEAGYRFAGYMRKQGNREKEAPLGAMQAGMLGLLAFILTFTFGMSASRFDARKQLVLAEANVVGTTYLRAQLLPASHSEEIQRLLREYVDTRLEAVKPEKLEAAIIRSEEIHTLLWKQAISVSQETPDSFAAWIFIQSLNDVIDTHQKRLTTHLQRIPETIWGFVYLIAGISMFSMGYYLGLSGSRRSIATVALSVSFSAVIMLIVDLDRPQSGMLKVSQGALIHLQQSMLVDQR